MGDGGATVRRGASPFNGSYEERGAEPPPVGNQATHGVYWEHGIARPAGDRGDGQDERGYHETPEEPPAVRHRLGAFYSMG